MRVVAVLNRDGGTFKTTDLNDYSEQIKAAFLETGHELDIKIVTGKKIVSALNDAASLKQTDCILAGGGDGTTSAAAAACWKHDKILGVIPAGTMNLFARSLKIPLDIEQALPLLADGRVVHADLATMNGRAFLHQVSVGMQPKVIRERASMDFQSRIGKIMASLRALLNTVSSPPSFDAAIKLDDGAQMSKTLSMFAVSNNPHSEGHLPYSDTFDAGKLGVYTTGMIDASANLKLVTDMFLGNWSKNDDLTVAAASKVAVNFPNTRSRDKAVIDGELIKLDKTMEFIMHPKALRVLIPK